LCVGQIANVCVALFASCEELANACEGL
jgi:hypothetical protein